ncbi:hypothetical protein CQ017_03540 [Arthrobacter sp. MYb224]|uniref:flavin reductase family protein n=1 Tax=Arthrobacter sp. MYb224 TaxID=1848600 RepID=UPI000CFB7576|nr:iron-sulfur cluster-binding domain-containing protein [Arthrobacter sp. MYb224]PRA00126.1 hypothetical protein CQ017_03540 [Arthrobacter sp. MYb224]
MTGTAKLLSTASAQRLRGLEMPWNRVLSSQEGPASAARALGPWHPQEFLAECVQTIEEAGGLMTFVFRRLDGAPLAFRAGQYLNIAFPVHGEDQETVDRSYSISSAPTVPWTFNVSIKRDPKGLVSTWAHENLRPGMVLDMLGPVGAFHLGDSDRRARFLFLGAGAGVTPIMSMVRTIHSLPGQADVVVLCHGTVPGDFPFWRELEYIKQVDPRIRVSYSLGNREKPADWDGYSGRLTAEMIEAVAPDANGRKVFACGPEGYLNSATKLLREVGVDDTSVFMEFFSGDRKTLLEYQAEIALAEGIAEEVAESVEEFYESQPPELSMYEPDYDETGTLEAVGQKLVVVDSDVPLPPAEPLVSEEEPPAASSFPTVGEGELTMTFLRTAINVKINSDERILGVAQRAGVRIGANCQEGMCGSCKVVKLEGDVEMNHQGGIRAREITAGKFLPCCSTAQTDLVIDA